MENNSAKFAKLLKNMRCYSFKICFIIDTMAIFKTQSQIQDEANKLILEHQVDTITKN